MFPPANSISSGARVYTHSYFGGAWTAQDRATVDKRGALLVQNMRFFQKQTETRYGHGVVLSITGEPNNNGAHSLFNWLSELGNYLVWYNNGDVTLRGVRLFKVSDNPPVPTLAAPISPSGVLGVTYGMAGPRLYAAFWGVDGTTNELIAVNNANAVAISYSGGFHSDLLFPGPPSTTLVPATAPTEPGAGIVTAGLHNIGLRMQHRSGFLGRPGPDSSTSANPTPTTFAPVSFTSAGSKNLNWTFTPGANWPADVISVQLVMSPVSNPNRYFLVPGAAQAVTGGAATGVNITINIDDGTLISSAATEECTDSLNFYTASATGNAKIPVIALAHIGNRMFYVSTLPDDNGNNYSVLFASDPFEYQQISLDQHLLQLPNQLKITQAFSVVGAIYIVGPHWTYITQDTGGTPLTWPSPEIVDGRKGAIYPNLVEVNAQGRYAWIGDKTGAYLFDGAYADLPISYLQSDTWTKIGFTNTATTMKDDPLRHRLMVLANVSSSLARLTWDYTNGLDPYASRFSSDTIPSWVANGGVSAGCMEIVQNDLFGSSSKKSPELWYGPFVYGTTQVGAFWREKDPAHDTNVYSDDSDTRRAIHTIYEPCIFPSPGGDNDIVALIGAKIRMTGSGTIQPAVYNFDKTASISLNPATDLAAIPSGMVDFRAYLISQNGFSFRVEQNVLDGHFTLSEINVYYNRFGSLL